MPLSDAIELLENEAATPEQLLNVFDSLCREHGYIKGVIRAGFMDKESGKKSLDNIEVHIQKIRSRLNKLVCTT